MTIRLFRGHNVDEHANSTAAYLPGGRLFAAGWTPGSVLRGLIRGVSAEFKRVEDFLRSLAVELDPRTTSLFITEWERNVGIPDTCYQGTGTLTERRRDVLAKLVSSGLQTEQDYIDFVALFGWTATVSQGASKFEIIITFIGTAPQVFPLTYPIPFGDPLLATMSCILSKLKPANCTISFVATP